MEKSVTVPNHSKIGDINTDSGKGKSPEHKIIKRKNGK
jgi:hypothetical protein